MNEKLLRGYTDRGKVIQAAQQLGQIPERIIVINTGLFGIVLKQIFAVPVLLVGRRDDDDASRKGFARVAILLALTRIPRNK